MPNESISQLTQIGRTALPGGSFSPTTGDMIEILDTTDTTMASTGTNRRIAPGDLLYQYLAAGSNIAITEASGVVTISENPVTQNIVTSSLSSSYTVTTSFTNTGLSISVTAGTWLLMGAARAELSGSSSSSSSNNNMYLVTQFYNSTAASVIANSQTLVALTAIQQTGATISGQNTAGLGPFIFTTASTVTLTLQAMYGIGSAVTAIGMQLGADSNGVSNITAMRIY